MTVENRYLYHWLPKEKLEEFHATGTMRPYWTHYVLDAGRFVKGISTTDEPMGWVPDEGLMREPCLVIDRTKIDHEIHAISSSEAFHLTREIRRLKRAKKDIEPAIKGRWRNREMSRWTPDEHFIEGPITWDAVVAIGFEDDGKRSTKAVVESARGIAEERGLALIDMSGWRVGDPGVMETDEIVEEAMTAAADVNRHPKP